MRDISVRRFQRTYASAATSRQERSIKTTSSKTTSTSRSFNSIEDETNQSSDSTRPPSPDFIRKGKTPASPLSTFGSSATSDFSFVTTKPTQENNMGQTRKLTLPSAGVIGYIDLMIVHVLKIVRF
ncbi:hypothetical protein M8J75_007514 [Diaphorina citri]|nr:hypothetical protein M8J75_007514 [Diaphorina citri]